MLDCLSKLLSVSGYKGPFALRRGCLWTLALVGVIGIGCAHGQAQHTVHGAADNPAAVWPAGPGELWQGGTQGEEAHPVGSTLPADHLLASAVILHVIPDAAGAADTHTGRETNKPLKTLGRAVELAQSINMAGEHCTIQLPLGVIELPQAIRLSSITAPQGITLGMLHIKGTATEKGRVQTFLRGKGTLLHVSGRSRLRLSRLGFISDAAAGNSSPPAIVMRPSKPKDNWSDIELDTCLIDGAAGVGLLLAGARNVTLSNVTVNGAGAWGMDIWRTTFSHFTGIRIASCGAGAALTGGLRLSGHRLELSDVTVEKNTGMGLCVHDSAKRVQADKLTLSHNSTHGLVARAAIGPLRMKSTTIAHNKGYGVLLQGMQRVVMMKSSLAFNGRAQIGVTPLQFTVQDMYGETPQAVTIKGNEQFLMVKCVVQASEPTSLLVERVLDPAVAKDAQSAAYLNFFQNAFRGSFNTYYHPKNPRVFESSRLFAPRTFTDLTGLQQLTGEELNATWQKPTDL